MIRTALIFALMLCSARAVENWPQFRGPDGQGHAPGSNPPLKWSEKENVKWKTPIHGRAWSCPIVIDKQVWVTTATEDGTSLYAVCVNLDSGKIELDKKLFDVPNPQFAHKFNSYGSPTPFADGDRVYVTFGSPGTACLDRKTGNVLWERRDFVCNHYRGAGSSPVVYNNLILMDFDGSDFQFVVALDKMTGKTVWKKDRSIDFQDLTPEGKPQSEGDWRKAFSTPLVANLEGQNLVLSLGSKALYAYKPEDGAEVWRVEDRNCHSGSSRPVTDGKTIFACMGFSKGDLLAIQAGGHGVVSDSHVLWKINRNVSLKPSLLLLDGLLYMIDDGGIATCLEAHSGKEIWRERVGGNFSASPVQAGNRIYFCSEEGKTTVISTGREYKVLAQNTLDDGFMASPAVVGNSLILRSRTALYRIEE